MKRIGIILLALMAVTSCGLTRRAAPAHSSDAPILLPLTDSADIARSRQRAQVVMDSIARMQTGVNAPEQTGGLAVSSGTFQGPAAERELVDQLLDYAKTFIGTPYRLGAAGPELFDCSGFTRYVFKEFGYDLPHNSVQQSRQSRPVDGFGDLRKGDLVFFGARGTIRNIGHVGIVTEVDLERGMFRFIHASTSNGVEIQQSTQPYFMMRYIGAGRILPD